MNGNKEVYQWDFAFCEYTEDQKLIEIKNFRFESEGQDHQNPKFYQTASKVLLS